MTSAQSRQTKRAPDAVSVSLIRDYSEEVRGQREAWLPKPVLRLPYNNSAEAHARSSRLTGFVQACLR